MEEKRTQLSIRIDPELLTRLKIVAVRKQTTVAAIIRDFVAWYVAKEETSE